MTQKPHTDDDLIQLICDIEEALRAGHPPPGKKRQGWTTALQEARHAAAQREGRYIPGSTLRNRLRSAEERGFEPNWALYEAPHLKRIERPAPTIHEVKLRVSISPKKPILRERVRVLCIGDAHDHPDIPKDRFEWIGRWAEENKPDVIIQIGDFCTLDSLNNHIPPWTETGRHTPSFENDMASFNEALQAFGSHLNHEALKHCTIGNHEQRLFRFEDEHRAAYGMMANEFDNVMSNNGWEYSAYGEFYFIHDTAFVHVPMGLNGKPVGGKTAVNLVARDSVHDIVFGHTHREDHSRCPKLGYDNRVIALNVGCALPDGHKEDYVRHSATGWGYGIYDLIVQGSIKDRHWIPMATLRERYG